MREPSGGSVHAEPGGGTHFPGRGRNQVHRQGLVFRPGMRYPGHEGDPVRHPPDRSPT